MNPSKIFFLILLTTLFLSGCKEDTQKIKLKNNADKNIITDNSFNQNKTQNGRQKTLTLSGISFVITVEGEGSIQELTIKTKGLKGRQQTEIFETDPVVNAEIGDLNSDGFPELLVFTSSAGSGSYGDVIGYSVNAGESMSQIYFPEMSENYEVNSGYMGHDEFNIVGTYLVQKFPIYKKGDANSNPTGGYRKVEYSLQDGEASRTFVVEKVSDFTSQ